MFTASIGKKLVMALTGTVLVLFLIGHVLGNLEIFLGREALNGYAAFLHANPMPLWAARTGLIIAFVVHIYLAFSLARENRQARPQGYLAEQTIRATFASRTMMVSGLAVLAFVIWHLMHFTFFKTNPEYATMHETLPNGAHRHDVHRMIVAAFSNPVVVVGYVVAQAFLFLHLSHAVSSMLKTFGCNHPRTQELVERAGPAFAAALFVAYVSIPLAVLVKIVTLSE